MKVVLVAHTHWDREWYEPFAVFRSRLLEMFDGLIDLLDREPRFRHFHLDGQATMVDDYLELRPERRADLLRLFRAGRLSLGPWYTQMDEFLTSGESTIRNLEWGLARARSFGLPSPVDGPWAGYLPDQFGHIGQMPQLLRRAGIDRAVVFRGVPSAVDRAAFRWRSPDGSEVLAEYFAYGYDLGEQLPSHLGSAADMADELRRVVGLAEPLADRDVLLIPVGGDHTVPAAPMAELLDDVAELTGLEVEIGSIAGFLARAPEPPGAPTWTGELRAASHAPLLPNVYSTRPHQKRRRAQLEGRLERYAEPLAALVPGVAWPAAALEDAWRQLLWNGAHDSVCGCSHDQVARDVDARYERAETLIDAVVSDAATRLAASARSAGTLRWNPSSFEREGIPGLGWTVAAGGPPAGEIAQPVELHIDRERVVLDDGTTLRFSDEDDIGDLYTYCPPEDGEPLEPLSVESIGAGRVVVRFAGSSIELEATRRGGDPVIRLDGRIHNARPDHRLRLWVELDAAPGSSTALAPFEVVDRPLVGEGYAFEAGSPTWPARGAVLAARTAVLAEGVIEYEVAGDRLAITLLRATGIISQPTLATRPIDAGPETLAPDAQCLGSTLFALGIWREARREGLVEAWERFALPILEVHAPGGGGQDGGRLLEVDGAHLSAVRRVTDADADGRVDPIEVRLWNDLASFRTARVGGRTIELRPAAIETIRLDIPVLEGSAP